MSELAKSATAALAADFCKTNVFLTRGNVYDEKKKDFFFAAIINFLDQNEGIAQNNVRIGILVVPVCFIKAIIEDHRSCPF